MKNSYVTMIGIMTLLTMLILDVCIITSESVIVRLIGAVIVNIVMILSIYDAINNIKTEKEAP